jgi:CheY-like chemotaxis protein
MTTRQGTIWVIDDDDVFQFTITKIFKLLQLPENVHVFPDGEKAIERLRTAVHNEDNTPDIIFLDINMPIMDGWQFLDEYAKLKSGLSRPTTIYMVTSSVDPADIRQANSRGEISEYLTKPMSFEKVRELVGRKENHYII